MSKPIEEKVATDIRSTAKHIREAGGKIIIEERIPFIAVEFPVKGETLSVSMQGEEAADLLLEVPVNVKDEDYVLWYLSGAIG